MNNPTINELIKFGYILKELPPPFFSDYLEGFLEFVNWEKNEGLIKKRDSDCLIYSVSRPNKFRRDLSIPNPFFHLSLCKTICDNWSEIEPKLCSNLSVSNITFPIKNSFITKDLWEKRKEKYIHFSATNKFVLTSDISRFYNTIYTHRIATAIHGNLQGDDRNDKNKCGVRIDYDVRKCRLKKTHGIPTGPITSYIIHEIIGCGVDKELEILFSNKNIPLQGIRNIDDFDIFFPSKKDAEIGLILLQEALKQYELEINPIKTKIIELPFPLEPEWLSILYFYEIRDKSVIVQRNDIIHYFNRVFHYSTLYPSDNVIKYSLFRFYDWNNYQIKRENWDLFESFLLNFMNVEGSCIELILDIIYYYHKAKGYPLNIDKIKKAIYSVIFNSLPNHHQEITWALWMGKVLKIPFPKEIGVFLSSNFNPIIALIAFDLVNHKLLSNYSYPDTDIFKNPDSLYSDKWMLVYEVLNKNWMPDLNSSILESDALFKQLKDKNVTFYNEEISIPREKSGKVIYKPY